MENDSSFRLTELTVTHKTFKTFGEHWTRFNDLIKDLENNFSGCAWLVLSRSVIANGHIHIEFNISL